MRQTTKVEILKSAEMCLKINDAFIVFSKKEKSCNITSLTLKLEVGVILQSSDLLDDQKECLLSAFLQRAPKSLKEKKISLGS